MRHLVVTAGLLLIAAPASSQIVRVSVSTPGAEANAPSGPPSISASGRFVVFASLASNLVTGDTNGFSDVFLRDRDTDADGVFDEAGAVATTRLSLGTGAAQLDGPSTEPAISADGRYVAFVSTATNLVAGASTVSQVYRLDRMTSTVVRISETAAGDPGTADSDQPVIDADGGIVAFRSAAPNLIDDPGNPGRTHIVARDVDADTTARVSPIQAEFPVRYPFSLPSISADGVRIAFIDFGSRLGSSNYVADRSTGVVVLVPTLRGAAVALTSDGRTAVARTFNQAFQYVIDTGATGALLPAPQGFSLMPASTSPSGRLKLTEAPGLVDFQLGVSAPLPFAPVAGAFSADDRWLAVLTATATLLPGGADTNNVDDVFVIDLPDYLDADDDTMDDRWETLFGVTDPAADPDGDGQTNAQEEDAGTHPNGQVQRFLAEGATGTFFHTTIALANPSPTLAATAVLTFDNGAGARVRRPLAIPAGQSAVVDVGAVSGLEASDVSTTVESDRLLGIERSMTWGTPTYVYGSHAETATTAPSETWFLAEGSTVLGFDLFYLLQNPQATATHATVRFLLPSGTTIMRGYDLAPGSRTTIYVNQIAGLEETDVSGDISADAPIVVERSMYRSRDGEPFSLGSDSMGVTAPATSWFLAEGATGTFFDLYVLIANPGNTDATVRADYAQPDGSVVTQTYPVRAHSRHSVYVDAIAGLTDTSVATTLTSTNGVPVVAERAMYWPGGFFDYYEGHTSAGSTATALEWVVAGGDSGGRDQAQTFVLIANTENRAGEATVTILPAAGEPAQQPMVVALPANSRTTIPLLLPIRTFGARILSTGTSPVQLVVESAVYRSPLGTAPGVLWIAGSNALATPVVP